MFDELDSPLRPESSLICQWPGRTARGQLYLGCYHRYSMCLQPSVLPKTLENERSLQDLSQENPPVQYRIVKDRVCASGRINYRSSSGVMVLPLLVRF